MKHYLITTAGDGIPELTRGDYTIEPVSRSGSYLVGVLLWQGRRFSYLVKKSWDKNYYSFDAEATWHRQRTIAFNAARTTSRLCEEVELLS